MRIRLTRVQVVEYDEAEPGEGQTSEQLLAENIKEGEEFPDHVFFDAEIVVTGEILAKAAVAPPPIVGCDVCRGARHMQNDTTGEVRCCWKCNAGGQVDKSLIPGQRWAGGFEIFAESKQKLLSAGSDT